MTSTLDRFNSRVKITKGCWFWTRGKDWDGYGIMRVDRVSKRAHRVSYELFIGEIPDGMLVCHRCDNPSCVNPKHLFIGTPSDNARDMAEKNRSPFGEESPRAKLTESNVESIRELRNQGKTLKSIASKFGVCHQLVSRICSGGIWRRTR